MSKITRYTFTGYPVLFILLCLTVIGIPFALLYLLHGTIAIEEEVDDPEGFLHYLETKQIRRTKR